jgi:hypothetical protein
MITLADKPPTVTNTTETTTEPICVLDTRVVTGSGGGPDKTILNSPRYLDRHGYKMLCGYLHPPGDPGYPEIIRKAERYKAPLVSIPDRGPWEFANERKSKSGMAMTTRPMPWESCLPNFGQ